MMLQSSLRNALTVKQAFPYRMSSKSCTLGVMPQSIVDIIITHVRVVAHTMGPVAPGAQLNQNHWSIYLVHSKGSVRINMQLQDASSNSTRGLLTVTDLPYASVSHSAVRAWDFEVMANFSVYHALRAIIAYGRPIYNMTETGVGCRYWM